MTPHFARDAPPGTMAVRTVMDREQYDRDGFSVLRGVYGEAEIAELAEEARVLWDEGRRHPSTFRHGNVLFRIDADPAVGPSLRFVQWAARASPVCERCSSDRLGMWLRCFGRPVLDR